MNRETKATCKASLVKINLVSVRVTSPFFVTRDPNFYWIRELKPILDLLLVLSHKGTRDIPSFIGGGNRSSLRDHVISEATSPSTPYKAWNSSCSLTRKDEKRIKDMFQFPDSIKIRIPSDEERACHSYAKEVCFYKANFTSGLCFLVHPFVRELFSYLHLALAQLVPNSW